MKYDILQDGAKLKAFVWKSDREWCYKLVILNLVIGFLFANIFEKNIIYICNIINSFY
jgi:hypothetical protein